MVDITKFFIINQEQFESIINSMNLTLSTYDQTYLLTYIIVNIFAYFMIFMFLMIVKFMYYKLFSRKGLIIK